MNQEEATKAIAALTAAAYEKLKEAADLAEEHQIRFHFEPEYGMGGTYIPASEYNDTYHPFRDDTTRGGWYPSSQSC